MGFGWDCVPTNKVKERVFPAELEFLDEVINFVINSMEKKQVESQILFNISVVVEEIFVNISSYAYEKSGRVKVSLCPEQDAINMLFTDTGIHFNPLFFDERKATEAVANLTPGGLGIMMVKKIAEKVEYRYENKENQLFIRIGLKRV